jgi:hypothetical protein
MRQHATLPPGPHNLDLPCTSLFPSLSSGLAPAHAGLLLAGTASNPHIPSLAMHLVVYSPLPTHHPYVSVLDFHLNRTLPLEGVLPPYCFRAL